MIKRMQIGNQQIWYDELLFKEPLPENILWKDNAMHPFDPNYWQKQGKILGSAQGRGITWFVQTQTLAAALRHYRRGGLFGKLISDHYLFLGWRKTRSYQEFILLHHLIDAGVNVPTPIAARAVKRSFCYQADLLSEKIPNTQDLASLLQQTTLPDTVYHSIGQQIYKMHQAQVNHTDLNIHNILIDQANKVWIIDFDKCAQQTGDAWKIKNIERLRRSFLKEKTKRNIHWQPNDFEALLIGYHSY